MIDVKKVEDFEKLTTSLDHIASAIENIPEPTPSGGIDYSTEEQDTGLKWIDGRTIYQKTITTAFSSSSAQGTNFYYGNVDYTSYFDITDWSNTYMNAILDKTFLTLADGTVRNVWYVDFQNVPSIAFCFPFTNRSGQLTVTFQYVKGDDLP